MLIIYLHLSIGGYGRRSDGGIFKECIFKNCLVKSSNKRRWMYQMRILFLKMVPHCLVGDEAFPLKEYSVRKKRTDQREKYL